MHATSMVIGVYWRWFQWIGHGKWRGGGLFTNFVLCVEYYCVVYSNKVSLYLPNTTFLSDKNQQFLT